MIGRQQETLQFLQSTNRLPATPDNSATAVGYRIYFREEDISPETSRHLSRIPAGRGEAGILTLLLF